MPEYLSKFYYTTSIQLILNLIFILTSIIHLKKIKNLRLLLIYSFFTLAQSLFGFYINIFEKYNLEQFLNDSVKVLALIEFVFFYNYIAQSLKTNIAKNILLTISSILAILIISNWLIFNHISDGPIINFLGIESFLLIIACLFYYFEFFKYVKSPTNEKPIFWSISGIFILSLLLFPISLQDSYIYLSERIITRAYTITFMGYSVLFISFINAIKCQIQQ